jgi:hypothetical protein
MPGAASPLGLVQAGLEILPPVEAARSLRMPILVLQSERDYQATMADFNGLRKALSGRAGVTLKS